MNLHCQNLQLIVVNHKSTHLTDWLLQQEIDNQRGPSGKFGSDISKNEIAKSAKQKIEGGIENVNPINGKCKPKD